jgi:hypothetical protein
MMFSPFAVTAVDFLKYAIGVDVSGVAARQSLAPIMVAA